MRSLVCQLWMRKKAEGTESIRDGDNDHAFVRELVAPIQGHRGRPVDVTPSVYPDNHRQAFMCAFRRRPYVEVETILAHRRWRLTRHRHTSLHTSRRKHIRLTRSRPACHRSRNPPTQGAHRAGSQGTALGDTE